MSMKIIKQASWETESWYELAFDDGHGNGYGFPCDASGKLLPNTNPAAQENYEYCLQHPEKFKRFGVVDRMENRYRSNAVGKCICGAEVELWDQYMGACDCPKCGRWYNLFGQELLQPEQWESGEDW